MITDDPAEYAIWQRDQVRDVEMAEEHHLEQLHEATNVMKQIHEVVDINWIAMKREQNMSESIINSIKESLKTHRDKSHVFHCIMSPILQALNESEYLLEASRDIFVDPNSKSAGEAGEIKGD